MRSSWRRLGVPWLFILPACTAAPPPAPPPQPPPPGAVAAPEPPSGPDLSPVAEPQGLLVLARWKAPAKSIDQILQLFKAPVSVEGLLAEKNADAARILDLDGSFDVAVCLDPDSTDDDPKVLASVSIPLRSFDEARAQMEKEGATTTVRPGVIRLPVKSGEKAVCDLAVAPGDAQGAAGAPARLVCGNAKDLEVLRDWLARGLPRMQPHEGAFTATLRAAPLKDRYLGKLHIEAANAADQARAALAAQGVSDPELTAAPGAVLDEGVRFLEDLDRIELRSALAIAPPELRATAAVRFAGRSSWLTRVITDVNQRSGPVPEMFWHAPRDAYSASWGQSSDPHLFDGIRSVVHKALAEGLGRVPLLPPADRDALLAFVDGVPRTPGVWVSSSGVLPPRRKPGGKPNPVLDAQDLLTGTLGWHVSGIEAPAAEYVTWARQGLDVYDRGVRLVHEIAGPAKGAGKAAKKDSVLDLIPRIKEVKAPPGWPKGTDAFDVLLRFDSDVAAPLVPGKAGEALKKLGSAKVSLTLRLAIVPDGDRTWVGFSADLDELKKRMSAVVGGAPAKGTLAAREGLDELRRPGQTWGGFVGFGDLLERAVESLERESPEHAADARALLASLPNKGKTPVLLIGAGTTGQAPSSSVEVRLQSGTLADLTGLVTFLVSDRGRELLKKAE